MMKILKRKNKKGFTLMEMLIVIGIIAILVAIAIPTFSGAQKKARYSADLANVRSWYAESLTKFVAEETTELPKSYNGPELQMTGATVTPTGTKAEEFKVVYDPNGTTADEDKYKSVTFPTPAATPAPSPSESGS